jgi:hypothetical protein
VAIVAASAGSIAISAPAPDVSHPAPSAERFPANCQFALLIQHTESREARHFAHATNARELSMTNDASREDDVPMHPRVAAYEAHLISLERELPSFERELPSIEHKLASRMRADGCLS